MALAKVARETAVNQILRYELYRHESLTERIRSLAASASACLDPGTHQATWRIIFYVCRCYYTGHRPTITDVYLSAEVSKVTAIKRVRELARDGVLSVAPDIADRRRKQVLASPALRGALDRFVDDYVGDLRRMMADARGAGMPPPAQPPWLGPSARGGLPRRRTAFLGDFNHEMRVALNSILGFADAIRSEILGPLTPLGYREYANDIHGAGCRLQTLVDDLVEMTQAALDNETPAALSVDELDAGEIVSEVVAASRETAIHAGVGLATYVPSGLPAVKADGRRLSQALLGLLGHAIRQNEPGASVTVETETVGETIRFRVRHSGEAWVPAAQTSSARSVAPGSWLAGEGALAAPGAKLELVLSRSLIRILGGELRFETESDGTASATIDLPLTPAGTNRRPYAGDRGSPRS